MNDDWRLRVDLHEDGLTHRLGEMLAAEELEHNLESTFHDRVVVSVDDNEVFCYTGTREQAEGAEGVIRKLAGEHGWTVESELTHWHPTAERWEDPDTPLPTTPAQAGEEREERIEDDREESAQQGYPEFEVKVQCSSRGEAAELSSQLDAEGIVHVHRWSYLLVGATDEESAQELADRLRSEVPSDATVTVELNARAVYETRPWSVFSIFGGMGG